jgi:hypothetical protein
MQNPKPFAIYQPVPGQSAKPLFVNHAYSLEQARARSSRQQYPARPSLSARSRRKPVIPDTRNGLPAMACVSAMQKAIRRGWNAKRWSSRPN